MFPYTTFNYNSYLKNCIKFIGLIGFILSPFVIYIYSSGEYLSPKEVANKQLAADKALIYGTALHDITFNYKNHMLSRVRPKIVALGSSRIMQFRDNMFAKKFYNLGGVMNNISEGLFFSSRIIEEAPEVVILNADIWWFIGKFSDKNLTHLAESDFSLSPKFSPADLIKTLKWIYEGSILWGEMYNQLNEESNHIGISGNKGDGFGPDGSRYYTRVATGKKASGDTKFSTTTGRINKGINRFEHSASANKQSIKGFMDLVKRLTDNNIHVIVFFPPFAPIVNGLMSDLAENYFYIEDIKQKLKNKGLSFYDYTDPLSIGSNSCEFIDGFHGGDILYMRILVELALKDSILEKYIDRNYLLELIKQYEGFAFLPDSSITRDKEIDFLQIGCEKSINRM